jgi:hypothetical protein
MFLEVRDQDGWLQKEGTTTWFLPLEGCVAERGRSHGRNHMQAARDQEQPSRGFLWLQINVRPNQTQQIVQNMTASEVSQ